MMRFLCIAVFSILIISCETPAPESKTEVDVLVIGGGTGGTAAGLQASRMGVQTLIAEPTPWLGGMLTAAGVSATDGNHQLPAGIWREFRKKLWNHYGSPDSVATGWVSNTQFEPHIGAEIFRRMAQAETNLAVWHNSRWQSIEKTGGKWQVRIDRDGTPATVIATVLIDGTDLGDVAAAAGAGYDLGMDARSETGESMAPEESNDIIQDLTYAAILKDYGPEANKLLETPENYNPAQFLCSCAQHCDEADVLDCQTMLNYGKLPNEKYMINWPNYGNDIYLEVVEMSREKRAEAFEKAKQHTLSFVYYIQNDLGFSNLGLADDEFPTDDLLPLIPYHREGRRIHGLVQLNVNHILAPLEQPKKLFRTGIAVGDYPIDHHHKMNPEAPEIEFPPVPSFNIPLGCLISKDVGNLLVADKAISVTNIVNGSTRLQPVVLQIGQAAGCAAALSVQNKVKPSEINVREVQQALLEAKGFLMPYLDVQPEDSHFASIQKVGATGIMWGEGVPYKWANQTWFYPDTTTTKSVFVKGLQEFYPAINLDAPEEESMITIGEAIQMLESVIDGESQGENSSQPLESIVSEKWTVDWKLTDYNSARPITRRELAVLIDKTLDPFSRSINFHGE